MHKHAHQLINDNDPDCSTIYGSTLKSGADPVGGGGGGDWAPTLGFNHRKKKKLVHFHGNFA